MSVGSLTQPAEHPLAPQLASSPFTSKIKMEISVGGYTIKTASTSRELDQVIALRNKVFLEEFAGGQSGKSEDWDEFDEYCDFLIIKTKKTDEVIAVYRIIFSENSPRFYSQTEFNLGSFLQKPGSKIELSRACVRSDSRTGICIHLLWKGIGRLISITNARYLFGLSSIQTFDVKKILGIINFFEKNNHLIDDKFIIPAEKHKFLEIDDRFLKEYPNSLKIDDEIPPLLLSYIGVGAKVARSPAIDLNFGCIDFLTILDCEEIAESLSRKYLMDL